MVCLTDFGLEYAESKVSWKYQFNGWIESMRVQIKFWVNISHMYKTIHEWNSLGKEQSLKIEQT